MQASVEPVEGNRVKLSVEVDEADFEKFVDETARKLSRRVRVPGFRPGKAPRRLIEARMGGSGAVRKEALQDALPSYYAEALRDAEVDAIAAPEITVTSGEDTGALAFDAVVEVRPRPTIAGYQGLQVTVPSVDVTDDDVSAQLDRLREQFGELSSVGRPARDGDNVSIDVRGYRHSETVDGMTAEDLLVEVGKGAVVPELDEHLRGANPGDIFKFNATAPTPESPGGEEIGFQVLVKDVKEKILPQPSDEWASEASEFETLDGLKADLRKRIGEIKRVQAQLSLRDGALSALIELVNDEVPDVLVSEEMQRRIHDLSHRLEEQGATLAQYIEASGASQEQFVAGLREQALRSVKADLALRSLADAEGVEVTDEELDAELARTAAELNRSPAELRAQLDRGGRLPGVRSDMRSAKAVGWLLENVELVDEEGRPVDRAGLQLVEGDDGADAEGTAAEDASAEGPEQEHEQETVSAT